MNYERIYSEFIADRLTKQPSKPEYFEKHHILPRSLGGLNGKENLIRLTMEDHIHAHILLAKIHGGRMWGAALMMTKTSIGRTRSLSRVPSKDEIRAAAFSRRMYSKHCRGENSSQYGRAHTDDAKNRMSAAHKKRGADGLMWTQQNPGLISGDNHWTKQSKNASRLESAIPIFKKNLQKAAEANAGSGNVMHRPEVKEKVSKAQKDHWANGTGIASKQARANSIAAHSTEEYLSGARDRVFGEKNPMHGMGGALNPNSRKVLCVDTGVIYESVKEAAEFCGGDVTKAARTGGKAGGYSWVRIGQHTCDGRQTKTGGISLANPVRASPKA